jgi:hypothetical protein
LKVQDPSELSRIGHWWPGFHTATTFMLIRFGWGLPIWLWVISGEHLDGAARICLWCSQQERWIISLKGYLGNVSPIIVGFNFFSYSFIYKSRYSIRKMDSSYFTLENSRQLGK